MKDGGLSMNNHISAEQGQRYLRCSRCGASLPRAGIACNQRNCRPEGLRVITLHALQKNANTDPVLPQHRLSVNDNGKEQATEPIEPVTPPSLPTPSTQQKERN